MTRLASRQMFGNRVQRSLWQSAEAEPFHFRFRYVTCHDNSSRSLLPKTRHSARNSGLVNFIFPHEHARSLFAHVGLLKTAIYSLEVVLRVVQRLRSGRPWAFATEAGLSLAEND